MAEIINNNRVSDKNDVLFQTSDEKLELFHQKKLGFTWRNDIRRLLSSGKITQEQHDAYVDYQTNKTKTQNSELKNKFSKNEADTLEVTSCANCGKIINAGTYGAIMESIHKHSLQVHPYRVIKGTIQSMQTSTKCPTSFTTEVFMYDILKEIVGNSLKVVSMLQIFKQVEPSIKCYEDRVWMENSRCYYEMEKIFPYKLSNEQKQNIHTEIETCKATNNDVLKFALEDLLSELFIFMLVPSGGNKLKKYYNRYPGNKHSNWVECGREVMECFFKVLGISSIDYYNDLRQLIDTTFEKNMLLIDVEFILGTVYTENSTAYKSRIFLIDFDKVIKKDEISENEKTEVIQQDMFPDDLMQSQLRGGTKKSAKRKNNNNNKHKKRGKKRKMLLSSRKTRSRKN